jgi:hypothetical protein
MRRLLGTFVVGASVMGLAACAHDGRGLSPANGHDQSIIHNTTAPSTTLSTSSPMVTDTLPSAGEGTDPLGSDGLAMSVSVPFGSDGPIPTRYTCDGAGVSPAVSWHNLPQGTVEVAIQVTDLQGDGYTHWVVAGLSPTSAGTQDAVVPAGAIQGTNTAGKLGWAPLCPPKGSQHSYLFEVDALDTHITLPNGTDGDTLLQAIGSATIASASQTGVVAR